MFISEFAETSIRGLLGTCFQLFLTIGILISYILGAIYKAPDGWVSLSYICAIVPVLYLIALTYIAESPAWLLKNVSQLCSISS